MNKQELLALCARLGVHPSRKLGQCFVLDGNLLRTIIAGAAVAPGERVLEIGAGTGALTEPLLAAGARVLAVEYDARLCDCLRERFGAHPGFTLVAGDACRLDYATLLGPGPWACVSNLPYAVASVVLARLLALDQRASRLVLLVQREMAERLAAPPHNKTYGALSVQVQALYRLAPLRVVPRDVFWPLPEVTSALVHLTLREDAPPPPVYAALHACVRVAFEQRRKQLGRRLVGAFPGADMAAAMAGLGLTPQVRAEDVTVPQFLALARGLATATAAAHGAGEHHEQFDQLER